MNVRPSVLLLPPRKDSLLYLRGREGGKEEGRRRGKLGMETPFIMMFFNSLRHKPNNQEVEVLTPLYKAHDLEFPAQV